MNLLQRNDLSRRARPGIREYRLVSDRRIDDGEGDADAWQGLGRLVSLVDAELQPQAQACLNTRDDLDAITLVLNGRIRHAEAGGGNATFVAWDVQIQPAESAGGGRLLVNPDETAARVIQLRLWPAMPHEPEEARSLQPAEGSVTRICGAGGAAQADASASRTCIDLARLQLGQSLDIDKPALVYVCEGSGFADEDMVTTGALIRSDQLTFDATNDTGLLIIHEEPA